MSMKRLLALVGASLMVLGTLAAVASVSGPSPGLPVSRTGAATSLRAHGSGIVGVELIPGNFPAWNGVQPVAVAYDSGKGEVFVTNQDSDTVSVISDATIAVVASIPVGSAVVVIPDGFQSLWVVYVGVASVAAVAVIVGVLLWRRRRARQLPPPQLPPLPP